MDHPIEGIMGDSTKNQIVNRANKRRPRSGQSRFGQNAHLRIPVVAVVSATLLIAIVFIVRPSFFRFPELSGRTEDQSVGALNDRLCSWIRKQGAYVSPKVRLHDFGPSCGGIGVIAAEDIDNEEVLVVLPKSLQMGMSRPMCERAIVGKGKYGETGQDELFVNLKKSLSQSGFVALCLLMLSNSTGDDGLSTSGYFQLLPDYLPNAINFDTSVLNSLRYGPLVEHALEIRQLFDNDWKTIQKELHRLKRSSSPLEFSRNPVAMSLGFSSTASSMSGSDRDSAEQRYRWTYSLMVSRGFLELSTSGKRDSGESAERRRIAEHYRKTGHLPPDVVDSGEYVMVPFDFFNHAPPTSAYTAMSLPGRAKHDRTAKDERPRSGVTYRFDHASSLVFRSVRKLKKNEQVLISYGFATNVLLVSQYGFVMPDNPLDFVTVGFRPDLEDPNREIKERILRDIGFEKGQLYKNGLEDTTMQAARIVMMEENDFSSYNVNKVLRGNAATDENELDTALLLRDISSAYIESLEDKHPEERDPSRNDPMGTQSLQLMDDLRIQLVQILNRYLTYEQLGG